MNRSLAVIGGIFSLFMICSPLFGQVKNNREIFLAALEIMEEHSLNSYEVDWKLLKSTIESQFDMDLNDERLGEMMIDLLSQTHDFHGAFYLNDQVYQWKKAEIIVSDSIMNEWKKGPKVVSMMLTEGIGYLRIPSMPFVNQEDLDAKAQNLNNHLCELLQNNTKGLIIDLRLNGGGAMYPMILGVHQLLPKGHIGSFQSKHNEKWFLTETEFLINQQVMARIKPTCTIDAQNIPVILLTSPITGSSAEFFIIALKSREAFTILGSNTAGYVTATEGFSINDSAYLLLSTAYGVDINGIVYKSAFVPDVSVENEDSFNDTWNDVKVVQAISSLKKILVQN